VDLILEKVFDDRFRLLRNIRGNELDLWLIIFCRRDSQLWFYLWKLVSFVIYYTKVHNHRNLFFYFSFSLSRFSPILALPGVFKLILLPDFFKFLAIGSYLFPISFNFCSTFISSSTSLIVGMWSSNRCLWAVRISVDIQGWSSSSYIVILVFGFMSKHLFRTSKQPSLSFFYIVEGSLNLPYLIV